MIEGMLHAGKSIKRSNSLPSLSSRLLHKLQDVDMNAALSVEFLLLIFIGNLLFIENLLNNAHSCISIDTTTGFSWVCFMTSHNHYDDKWTFLFYSTDSIPHLLVADTVTRVFVSMEIAIGWKWFKHGLCGIVWSNIGPSADYRL